MTLSLGYFNNMKAISGQCWRRKESLMGSSHLGICAGILESLCPSTQNHMTGRRHTGIHSNKQPNSWKLRHGLEILGRTSISAEDGFISDPWGSTKQRLREEQTHQSHSHGVGWSRLKAEESFCGSGRLKDHCSQVPAHLSLRLSAWIITVHFSTLLHL